MQTKTIDLLKQAIEKTSTVTRGSILAIAADRLNCSPKFLEEMIISKGNPRITTPIKRVGSFYLFDS